jgi:hypothetical protein
MKSSDVVQAAFLPGGSFFTSSFYFLSSHPGKQKMVHPSHYDLDAPLFFLLL